MALLATNNGRLRIYTLESGTTLSISDANNSVHGVTYDAYNNRIFWIDYGPNDDLNKLYKVYGANIDGTDARLLQCKLTFLPSSFQL